VLPGVWGLAVGLAAFGVSASATFAALIPWLDEVFGDIDRGLGYGLLNTIYSTGYTVGPVTAGVLFQLSGPELVYLVAAAPAVVIAALIWGRRGKPLTI